jgi:glutamate-1-semialdehyde 2,1-aminomutase/spore coat polysaccharide biosynthesis protein SpsF
MDKQIIIVTQARTGSTRFPEKVLKEISGVSLLEIHLSRLKKSKFANNLLVATTRKPEDERIIKLCRRLSVEVFTGSEENVLDRYWQSVKDKPHHYIVRVTSDCPLIDPNLIDEMIKKMISLEVDYLSNTLRDTFPDGQDIEIFTKTALNKAHKLSKLKSHKEHVTLFIKENSDYVNNGKLFTASSFERDFDNISNIRMTVDEQEDFIVIKKLIDSLGREANYEVYSKYYLEKKLNLINAMIGRNEGLTKSLNNEKRPRVI